MSVAAASLAAGNYTGSITITANGAVNSPTTADSFNYRIRKLTPGN